MRIEQSGDPHGMPVVLLHGAGVAGWMWRPLRAHLPADLALLVPDLPGHGASRRAPFVSRARTVEALAARLNQRGGEPVAVVGFSFGAQIAIELAARMPELVAHATIISAQAQPARLPRLTTALVRAAAPLARNERFARAQAAELFLPDELLDDYLRESRAADGALLARIVDENIRFRIPAGWGDFPGTAAVMVGADERRIMRTSAVTLHDALPGSALDVVDGCGHGIPLQRPRWLAERLIAQWG